MKPDLLRFFGPGTQLLFLVVIILFSFSVMYLTAFLVIRPIWQVNIFDNIEELFLMKDEASVSIIKVLQIFNHLGMFLIPALIFRSLFGSREKSFFVLKEKQETSVWLAGLFFFIAAIPLINYLHYLNLQIPFSDAVVRDDAKSTEILSRMLGGESFFLLLINIFIYAVLPAIGEEFLFRGVILRQIALATKKVHLAVWISAAFFSFIHGEETVFIPRFLMGAALGYIFVWSGSIWVSVLAHFINNLVSIIIINSILNDRLPTGAESIGMYEGEMLYVVVSLILTVASLYLFYMKRNNSYRMFMQDYEREEAERLEKNDDGIPE